VHFVVRNGVPRMTVSDSACSTVQNVAGRGAPSPQAGRTASATTG